VPRTASYPLIDRLLDGQLEDALRQRRTDGQSFADIARWLLTEHQLTLSTDTVRRWCIDLAIEKAA